ncbi:hypothetical protein D3C77_397370 [compost metagenome]
MLYHKRRVGFAAGCQAQAQPRIGGFAHDLDLAARRWAIAEFERSKAFSHERLQAGIQLEQRQVCALHAAPDPALEREGLPLVPCIDEIVEADAALDRQVMADHPVALVHAVAGGDDIGGAGRRHQRVAAVDQGRDALAMVRPVQATNPVPLAAFALGIGQCQ